MKRTEPPTKDELVRAIDDLFYAAHQTALYAYWKLIERPLTSSLGVCGIPDAKTYFNNGILESSLLLIRKTTEFFKPKQNRDRPDTLFAYRYLPNWGGICWLIGKDDYKELHNRIGHITIREARYGKQTWQIVELTVSAIEKWITFFSEVAQSLVFDGNPPNKKLEDFVASLKEVSRGCRVLLAKQTRT